MSLLDRLTARPADVPRRRTSSREVLTLVITVVVIALAIVSALSGTRPPGIDTTGTLVVYVTFALAIVLGELYAISAPGLRATAPIATSTAFALAFMLDLPDGDRLPLSPALVLAVIGVGTVAGQVLRCATGRTVSMVEVAGRLLAAGVATVLYRQVHLDASSVVAAAGHGDHFEPALRALLMLGISLIALLADVVFTTLMHSTSSATNLRRTFIDEVVSSAPLSSAVVVTGVLVALAAVPVGVAALPLFLAPLVFTLFAFRRYAGIRATYLQSIRTLSRLTDAAGYTPAGHSERVAALATALGRELGVSERELLDLEYAALLHDIGQVALVEPIPGGATVLAAPADQRRIENDTVDIVRETGVLDDVADILAHQTTPYRQVRELGERIPLTSRIVKVANAYEDLSAGARGPRARDSALERIYLGLGYEYDPAVVDALQRALAQRDDREGRADAPRTPSGRLVTGRAFTGRLAAARRREATERDR